MGRLQDKVAIITGGAGGLGAAASRLFAAEGAKVVVADVAEEAGRALAADIGGNFHRLDVTSEQGWAELVSAVDSRYGGVDVLVNAAGVEGDLSARDVEQTSLEEWRRVHAINLDGTFLGCRAVLPVMRRKKTGSIINLSSIVAFFGTPTALAYGSSKSAVKQFSKSIALHGAREGMRIRCNSVHPGIIKTRMVDSIFSNFARQSNSSAAELEAMVAKTVPFGELGRPEDVAALLLYLASDESSYVTGSEFMIDGGWHLIDAG